MRSKLELFKRYSMFFGGILFNALGVAFITRSMLGTGPTSCIPYVLSLLEINKFLTFGTFTFLFNTLLLLLQVILLRKNFKPIQLLQIAVNLLFSVLVDVAMFFTRGLVLDHYILALLYTVVGCILRAFGVSCSVVADVVMLSTEAFVKAVAEVSKKEFSICKLVSDMTMTAISAVLSFVLFEKINGVREGTLITVLLVGPISKFFTNRMDFAHHYFEMDGEFVYEQKLKLQEGKRLVITITSLAGSGGRVIARLLAEKLSIPVYDKELIDMVASRGHFPKLFVKNHNEKLYSNIAESFLLENYNFNNLNFRSYRNLFNTQCNVISELAEKEDCIIVGHCSNYVLRNSPNVLNIFISANEEDRLEYMQYKYKINRKQAEQKIRRQDHDTERYYQHFTGIHWRDSSTYHLTIDSSLLGYQGTVDLLEKLVRKHYLDVDKVKVVNRKSFLAKLFDR